VGKALLIADPLQELALEWRHRAARESFCMRLNTVEAKLRHGRDTSKVYIKDIPKWDIVKGPDVTSLVAGAQS
jgi:hypothetical protein